MSNATSLWEPKKFSCQISSPFFVDRFPRSNVSTTNFQQFTFEKMNSFTLIQNFDKI